MEEETKNLIREVVEVLNKNNPPGFQVQIHEPFKMTNAHIIKRTAPESVMQDLKKRIDKLTAQTIDDFWSDRLTHAYSPIGDGYCHCGRKHSHAIHTWHKSRTVHPYSVEFGGATWDEYEEHMHGK